MFEKVKIILNMKCHYKIPFPSQRLINLKYLPPQSDRFCSSFLQCQVKRIPSIPRSFLPSSLPQGKFTLL